MNEIVCATRGGEGSRAVQMAAIEQAKTTGNPLVFLYVVSPDTITDVEPALGRCRYRGTCLARKSSAERGRSPRQRRGAGGGKGDPHWQCARRDLWLFDRTSRPVYCCWARRARPQPPYLETIPWSALPVQSTKLPVLMWQWFDLT